MKICSKCNLEKDDNLFNKDRPDCKGCVKEYKKQYYINNKSKIQQKSKLYRSENKEKIAKMDKRYYEDNKEEINKANKEYYEKNKDKIFEAQKEYNIVHKNQIAEWRQQWYFDNKDGRIKEYRLENKEKISENAKQYAINNKDKIKESRKKYRNSKKDDPDYILRQNVSKAVNKYLRKLGLSKNNQSILKYLFYTIQELKDHLESQFEPWMTWTNWGKYNPKTWDDNDSSTWTWQIDHIIPHSTFYYTSMEDQTFKDCWALSNLRPLSAKQNILDGATKIRHKGKLI